MTFPVKFCGVSNRVRSLTSRGVVPRHDLGTVDHVVEGGPPRPRLVLGRRAEERLAAHHARVLAARVVLVVLVGERPLGALVMGGVFIRSGLELACGLIAGVKEDLWISVVSQFFYLT